MTSPPPDASVRSAPAGASSCAELVAALEPALQEAAGAGASLTSLTLDIGASLEPPWTVSAALERGTRTLAFVRADVRASEGALVATASAVFRRG